MIIPFRLPGNKCLDCGLSITEVSYIEEEPFHLHVQGAITVTVAGIEHNSQFIQHCHIIYIE